MLTKKICRRAERTCWRFNSNFCSTTIKEKSGSLLLNGLLKEKDTLVDSVRKTDPFSLSSPQSLELLELCVKRNLFFPVSFDLAIAALYRSCRLDAAESKKRAVVFC